MRTKRHGKKLGNFVYACFHCAESAIFSVNILVMIPPGCMSELTWFPNYFSLLVVDSIINVGHRCAPTDLAQAMCDYHVSETVISCYYLQLVPTCLPVTSLAFLFLSDLEIGFNPATYNVTENVGNVMVTVAVLSGTPDRDVEVSVSTVDGSATGREMHEEYLYGDFFHNLNADLDLFKPVKFVPHE